MESNQTRFRLQSTCGPSLTLRQLQAQARPIKSPAFHGLIHTCLTRAACISHCRVYTVFTRDSSIAPFTTSQCRLRKQTGLIGGRHTKLFKQQGGEVCISACVYVCGGGWRWEALPPILLLLKSSHERPCQELQCGLSGLSQRQSRLHDAVTHSHS